MTGQAGEGGQAAEGSIYRSLLEHAPDFIVQIDLDWRVRFLNRAAPGQAIADVVGRPALELMEPAYREIARSTFERVVSSGQPGSYETSATSPTVDSSPRSYLVRVAPVFDGDQVASLLLIATDVTDQRRAAQALAESESKLRAALAITQVGLFTAGPSTGAVEWDDTALAIFGVTRERSPRTLEGWLAGVHPDDRTRVAAHLAAPGTEGRDLELRVLRDDGVRWILCRVHLLAAGEHGPARLVGCVLDTTERHRLGEQLVQAQKMEAIGQLAAGMAHNFNNVLAAILPNVEIALRSAGEPARRPLENARDATLRAAALVKQLLVLAGHRLRLVAGAHDLAALAHRVVEMCRAMFDRRISIELACCDHAPVHGDAVHLEQVLLNLLINARDAVDGLVDRTPSIQVEVADDGPEPLVIRLTVRDNGVGMSEATRARIFEPFFTTKPVGHGTGLGLTTAHALVVEQHGTIECHSRLGEGSEVTVRLPRGGEVVEGGDDAPTAGVRGSETVLLVDDDELVRRVFGEILRGAGYQVLEAFDGLDALAVYQAHRPDIALCIIDQSMPRMSGQALLGSLLGLDPALKAISISGYGVTLKGARLGLDKPIAAEILLDSGRRLLDAD